MIIDLLTSHNHTNESKSEDGQYHQKTELYALTDLVTPSFFDSILRVAHVKDVELLDDG